jgi:hypothetical protein
VLTGAFFGYSLSTIRFLEDFLARTVPVVFKRFHLLESNLVLDFTRNFVQKKSTPVVVFTNFKYNIFKTFISARVYASRTMKIASMGEENMVNGGKIYGRK